MKIYQIGVFLFTPSDAIELKIPKAINTDLCLFQSNNIKWQEQH